MLIESKRPDPASNTLVPGEEARVRHLQVILIHARDVDRTVAEA